MVVGVQSSSYNRVVIGSEFGHAVYLGDLAKTQVLVVSLGNHPSVLDVVLPYLQNLAQTVLTCFLSPLEENR